MLATKGLALPDGTKVRITCDCGVFKKGDIVTRVFDEEDDDDGVRFDRYVFYHYLLDDYWELIEEPIQDTNNERLPKQGEYIQVRDDPKKEWSDPAYIFVCFYKNKVLAESLNGHFFLSEEWRFPPQEEVTLSDGKTYLVVTRGDEKILKLKQ